MELRLSNGVLRPFRPGDEASIARHANDRRLWLNLRDRFPHPYTLADAEQWVAFNLTDAQHHNLAIEVDNEAVGSIGLIPQTDVFSRSAEIGYWLGAAFWGRGIATEAVRAMTDHAFRTRNLVRLFAGVFSHNAASARVLEKAGYVLEGRLRNAVTKDGATLDQLLYARTT